MTASIPGFRFGYNTNGYAHHRLEDALEILAEQGWNAVALTLDVHHLDPFRCTAAEVESMRLRLQSLALEIAVETGARFVLDPRRKHRPTLLDPDASQRTRRLDYLRRCGDIAQALGAERLSFWSGVLETEDSRERGWERLVESTRELIAHLKGSRVSACAEPEPGMLLETVEDFARLHRDCPQLLLALDVGHLYVTGEERPGPHVEAMAACLGQVTIEDMVRGRHDHLPFGEGDVDVAEALEALRRIGWREPIYVELGRHGYDAVVTSRKALEHLRAVEPRWH